ncbi:hypothetical protein [Mycolicibacterium poriferae]|uniref:hypothetical protein n=1 Tax=Mycolicibacterium poriferae TaxID=39694 RepID=UPI0013D34A19|nr:hypothetical protein [Mycolicibacterium poriferae]MCV7261683.1 hypothetical protein [Mycolicibacterium poriferae]
MRATTAESQTAEDGSMGSPPAGVDRVARGDGVHEPLHVGHRRVDDSAVVGEPIVVSGAVILPSAPPRNGGWPVIS